jgi:hypothetical protein
MSWIAAILGFRNVIKFFFFKISKNWAIKFWDVVFWENLQGWKNGQKTFKTDLHGRKIYPKLRLTKLFLYKKQMKVMKKFIYLHFWDFKSDIDNLSIGLFHFAENKTF